MAIEVMLMDNVKKLGKAGEIVKVAPGYFRNYLAPKGASVAKRRLKKLDHHDILPSVHTAGSDVLIY